MGVRMRSGKYVIWVVVERICVRTINISVRYASEMRIGTFAGLMFFFFKQKTAYELHRSLVGSEMCIRDRAVR